jgi:hypothetical protein
MSDGQEYWQDWIGYWGYVQNSAADRWFKATQKLRTADYKVEHLWSDVSSFWMDTSLASMAVVRGQAGAIQPVIFWLDLNDSYAGPKTVPLFAGSVPNKPVSAVWLNNIDSKPPPKDHRLDWDNLDVRLNKSRTEVEIRLIGLDKLTPLAPATYRAIVHLDETPIAEVFIVVREPQTFGETSTHSTVRGKFGGKRKTARKGPKRGKKTPRP